MSSGSLDQFGAKASTTSSGSTKPSLRRVLKKYASYYDEFRTHLSLHKNAPDFRRPQKLGPIAAIPILGGLHHQYVRV
jgi:hypothetical protein